MAARNLDKSDIFVGRVQEMQITSDGSTNVLNLKELKDATFSVTEEIKILNTELEDGSELNEIAGRKVVVEGTIPEIEFTDESIDIDGLTQTDASATLVLTTSAKTITITLAEGDIISGAMDGNKVKISASVTKSGDNLPYAVT